MVNRRGNLAWLMAMVFALFVLLNAGALSAIAGVSLLAIFLFAYAVLVGGFSPADVTDRLLDAVPFSRPGITDAARRARMSASRRPDFDNAGYLLKDVGLVVEEPRADGLHLREARLISLDDEAIRPYMLIHAPRQSHPRQTLIRYEIMDSAGQQQFICEIDHWMRPGENLLLPNYRLPLKGNDTLNRLGAWELMVWVNGGLIASHQFNVSPSVHERRRQFGLDGEAQVPVRLEQDALPVSLDDLLSQQRGRTSRSSG